MQPEELSNSQLCLLYHVAIYKTQEMGAAPPEDFDRLGASVLADSPLADLIHLVPLADTMADAEALAVEHLDLRTLYRTQMTERGWAGEL